MQTSVVETLMARRPEREPVIRTKQHVVICFRVRVDQTVSPLLDLARILQVLVILIIFVIGEQRLVLEDETLSYFNQ